MKTTTIAATLLATAALTAHANIALNGGFETGIGADADHWNELAIFGGSAASTAARVAGGHSGDWAIELSVTGAPDYGPVAEIQQQTAVGSVEAGTEFNFSFWASGTPGPGSVAFYEVLWFDGDASNGGGPQGSATGLQAFSFGDTWSEISFTGMVAPTGADSVLIQIRLVTGAFDGASGHMLVDDVSFAVVPAPAGVLALGGLLGAAAARRRR